MKYKTHTRTGIWGRTVRRRRPSMPQFDSSLPAEHAADAAVQRAECFRRLKQLKRLPRKPMSQEVMAKICG